MVSKKDSGCFVWKSGLPCRTWDKATNEDPNIFKLSIKIKIIKWNVLPSYLDKYSPIMTLKARFKFRTPYWGSMRALVYPFLLPFPALFHTTGATEAHQPAHQNPITTLGRAHIGCVINHWEHGLRSSSSRPTSRFWTICQRILEFQIPKA